MWSSPHVFGRFSNNVISFFYMLSLGLATAAAVRVGNAIGRGGVAFYFEPEYALAVLEGSPPPAASAV